MDLHMFCQLRVSVYESLDMYLHRSIVNHIFPSMNRWVSIHTQVLHVDPHSIDLHTQDTFTSELPNLEGFRGFCLADRWVWCVKHQFLVGAEAPLLCSGLGTVYFVVVIYELPLSLKQNCV